MEFEHDRFKANQEAELERRKQAGQQELVKTITGNLGKVLEAPIVKELGRTVGQKIGVRENPIAAVQTRAAQEEVQKLSDPLRTVYGFTCNKCGQPKTFTELQMARIREENAGRWVCDSVGCGEVWTLKDSGPK